MGVCCILAPFRRTALPTARSDPLMKYIRDNWHFACMEYVRK